MRPVPSSKGWLSWRRGIGDGLMKDAVINLAMPVSLEISIGGFGGPNYQLTMADDVLEYRGWDCSTEPVQEWIVPTVARWTAFRRKLDKMDVWRWRKHYESELMILDGTQWNLELGYPDRSVQSSGSNAYPENFESFLRAVRALIGSRAFQ